jgi:uncharacterized protein
MHAPLPEAERIRSLDVLRGVAVLGIFVMNMRNFALPLRAFDNPAFPEAPATTADLWCWGVANVLFEDKMIAVFSMLFGAGIVVMSARAASRGRAWALHCRRMFWLFVIGVIHAYGLWYGDILNTYAVCGMALFPFRRVRPGVLIGLGLAVVLMAVVFRVGPDVVRRVSPPAAEVVQAESAGDRIIARAIETEAAAYRSVSWLELAAWRAKLNTFWHFYGCIDFNFWRCGGFMLIGMGLVQIGVLSASRPASVYWGLVIGGYAVGVGLCVAGFWPQVARALGRAPQLSAEARPMLGNIAWTARYVGAIGVAIGHVGVVMLLCRAGKTTTFFAPLAAAGRMALSNYLMQTVIGVLVFDGWAGRQWGTWRFGEFTLLVVGVWVAQLVMSPVWMRFFRFGPVEWAWRSLTYWSVQPMRRSPHDGAGVCPP